MSSSEELEEVPLDEISTKTAKFPLRPVSEKPSLIPQHSDETLVHEEIGWFQALWLLILKTIQKMHRWFTREVLGRRVGPIGQNEYYEVHINDPELNASLDFPSNYLRTAKYTIVTFVPKNLFEQFRRLSNIYFATIIGISFIPGVSPFIPAAGLLPLGFVMGVSAIKEAIEDYYRHKEDKRTNEQPCQVIRDGVVMNVACKDVLCGDIVCVQNMQTFPCDIVMISSSYQDGHCYVETANIDGETNLKLRSSIAQTVEYRDIDSISTLHASVQYELPNEMLYKFDGKLTFGNQSDKRSSSVELPEKRQTAPVTIDNLLHRVICVERLEADGAGSETEEYKPHIWCGSVHWGGYENLSESAEIFIAQALLVAASTINNVISRHTTTKNPFEGEEPSHNEFILIMLSLTSHLILYQRIIPISLWVTMEIAKVVQARFMEWDEKMEYIPPEDNTDNNTESNNNNKVLTPKKKKTRLTKLVGLLTGSEYSMRVKTSNLNEDLGKIQHIFSDKTGTLTENLMKFRKCSVNGLLFDEAQAPGSLQQVIAESSENCRSVEDFLQLLLLCNTIVPEVHHDNIIVYEGESPDEKSLVEAAKQNGFTLLKRSAHTIEAIIMGHSKEYQVLSVLEFTSARRRMSVIVKYKDEKDEDVILLLTKGADIVIFEKLATNPQNSAHKEITSQHLKVFAQEGLRTLVCAQRRLTESEYSHWEHEFHEARTAIKNRNEKIELACNLIENDLTLVGATAIEDRLQDHVPETIHYLHQAGINLWVLTGDKQETAINIGYSTSLIDSQTEMFVVNATTSFECLQLLTQAIEKHGLQPSLKDSLTSLPDATTISIFDQETAPVKREKSATVLKERKFALVIDGNSLQFALDDHPHLFLEITSLCRSVICCRVTPLQKALVVKTVKKFQRKITLAVGDGANDCNMIQEAHVGVGIFGREGNQAAMASDYAIRRFHHLSRLICVHGRYSYRRTTFLVQYFFYKNFAYTLCMFFFTFYCAGSAQTWFDQWFVIFWNMTFTGLPPLAYGIFEKDVSEDIIEKHPELYRYVQQDVLFTTSSFMWWMFTGCWHAVVSFFGTIYLLNNDVISSDGFAMGHWTLSSISATVVMILANLKVGQESRYWNIFSHLSLWGSIFVGYLAFYAAFCAIVQINPNNMYWEFYYLVAQPNFYLALLILCCVGLLPDFMLQIYQNQFVPKDWEIMLEKYKFGMKKLYDQL